MPQSPNYIRVKSRRELQRELSNSDQRVNKAGSGVGMPGGVSLPVGWSNPLGVSPPNSFYSVDHPGGDGMRGSTTKTWSASAGIGQGGVEGPSEVARTAYDQYQPLPSFYFDHHFADSMKSVDGSTRQSFNDFDRINCLMPGDVYRSGNLHEGGDGSVGRDIASADRTRNRLARPKKERGF